MKKGSITVEMCIVFPIVLLVLLMLIIATIYYSDVISVKTNLEEILLENLNKNNDIKKVKDEISEELKETLIISNTDNLKLYEEGNMIIVSVDISSKINIFNISLKNVVNIKVYKENKREYVVKSKVLIDGVKNLSGNK